jgi:hypothetical protein
VIYYVNLPIFLPQQIATSSTHFVSAKHERGLFHPS